jgi:hypothetical protein
MTQTLNFADMVQQIRCDYMTCRYFSAHDKDQLSLSLVAMWDTCLTLADVPISAGSSTTMAHPSKIAAQKDILRWFFALQSGWQASKDMIVQQKYVSAGLLSTITPPTRPQVVVQRSGGSSRPRTSNNRKKFRGGRKRKGKPPKRS